MESSFYDHPSALRLVEGTLAEKALGWVGEFGRQWPPRSALKGP